MLYHQGENWMADLGVACLIGLNAGHHFFEHVVAGLMCKRRQPYELKVGEAGLQNHIGSNLELNRILAQGELVKEMPGSNGDPVVGVIELVRPVELSVPAHQLVHEQQRNLRVAKFVQGTEASHGSPGTVTPKTRAAKIAYSCCKFRERQSCRVEF